jgi:hypothetical protein
MIKRASYIEAGIAALTVIRRVQLTLVRVLVVSYVTKVRGTVIEERIIGSTSAWTSSISRGIRDDSIVHTYRYYTITVILIIKRIT